MGGGASIFCRRSSLGVAWKRRMTWVFCRRCLVVRFCRNASRCSPGSLSLDTGNLEFGRWSRCAWEVVATQVPWNRGSARLRGRSVTHGTGTRPFVCGWPLCERSGAAVLHGTSRLVILSVEPTLVLTISSASLKARPRPEAPLSLGVRHFTVTYMQGLAIVAT